ncbi:hypothetical protein F2Q69_00032330 [Brassica cretica]|uniref:Uncharacterized protein n=1 Tax=Brassica cretica TaxID=69181 RepID=A0A8S9RTD2_BRACR|nr:hypothetical protein F2Q69_00032330 [Brassica cretica]
MTSFILAKQWLVMKTNVTGWLSQVLIAKHLLLLPSFMPLVSLRPSANLSLLTNPRRHDDDDDQGLI